MTVCRYVGMTTARLKGIIPLDFTTKPPMDFKFIGGLVCISLLQAFVYQFRSANPVAIGTECYLSLGIYNEY